MNIQIFGTNKCNDTKKAVRYFKERKIKYQFIDMKQKGMSRGELAGVVRAVGGFENLQRQAGSCSCQTYVRKQQRGNAS